MRLTAGQVDELVAALVDAFNLIDFRIMLRTKLGKDLDQIIIAGGLAASNLPGVFFAVVEAAERGDWSLDLVRGSRSANPTNKKLKGLSPQIDLPSDEAPTVTALESLIEATNSFLDPEPWASSLLEAIPRVCRITIPQGKQTFFGTGFLVGPQAVLTNFHVMESVIGKNDGGTGVARPADVEILFDYKHAVDGEKESAGTVFHLAKNWLVDHSPFSPADLKASAKAGLPGLDQLDYALIRVAGKPGKQPAGGDEAEQGAPPRGWIKLPDQVSADAFDSRKPLLILQHPSHARLKLAVNMEAMIGPNANGTRIRYRTNTEEGSSGSPCFDANWTLIGLHHSGDTRVRPTYNQGILITLIRERLSSNPATRKLLGANRGTRP